MGVFFKAWRLLKWVKILHSGSTAYPHLPDKFELGKNPTTPTELYNLDR